ncbi:unnamed protein product [Angiostrongylus costaricensis]|uniref:Rad60-SLD domain-containing protein n=1 Tax=Angiostrongylus costaricensis TaxID=334426 RepID=A0A0R3PAU2_ANGCS|nr:unnamed protein product [Angiostrongylus costaricensis]
MVLNEKINEKKRERKRKRVCESRDTVLCHARLAHLRFAIDVQCKFSILRIRYTKDKENNFREVTEVEGNDDVVMQLMVESE